MSGIPHWLALFLITWIPTLELRASIPVGVLLYKLPWPEVFLLCAASNALLALPVWGFLHFGVGWARRGGWFDALWCRFVQRAQERLEPYVLRWGLLGVALFIGVPLPGSGVYTGLVGAYVLGMDTRRAMLAACIGVLLAAVAVTLVTVSGGNALAWMINTHLME